MEKFSDFDIFEVLKKGQLPDPDLIEIYKDKEKRIFWLDGEVDCDTLELLRIIMQTNIEDGDKPKEERVPIKIFINTLGGDVQVMWALINAIKISQTPVYTIVYCNAMSAGAHILSAGHKRFALKGSTILVHSGSCQLTGDVEKVESAKKYFDGMSKEVNEAFLKDTKITQKELKKKGKDDWYLSAEEALEYGIIDKIIEDFTEVM